MMNNNPPRSRNAAPRVVVIGGGITGLSSAHRLRELSTELGFPLNVTVLEWKERPGGVISTRDSQGFLAEEGPDSFLRSKPEALDLSIRAGLEPRIIGTGGEAGRTFVVRKGRLIPLPDGIFPAPTRMMALFGSELLSFRGKLRMSFEPFIPRRNPFEDESAASFTRRRFGREAYERIAQPLLSGIYAGDPETLSVRAALPGLVKMEEQYGSVARGMRKNGAGGGTRKEGNGGGGRFASFDRGMGTLIEALVSRLPEGSVRYRSKVKRIDRAAPGWRVHLNGDMPIDCDAVIIALPAPQASLITGSLDLELSLALSQIKYVSTAVINLAYRRNDVTHPLDGSGFVVPLSESLPALACTFSNMKFPGRGPGGTVLFRTIMGGTRHPGICCEDDARLVNLAHGGLTHILGVKSPPVFGVVSRNPESMPHYAVGHGDLVSQIMERAGRHEGLRLAGNAYSGIGIPDCVRSGERAAQEIFRHIADREADNESNESCRRA